MQIKRIPIIIAVLAFLLGCSLLAYPAVSQWVNEHFQSTICADYSDAVAELDDVAAEEELTKAEEYNDELTEAVELLDDPFLQSEELDNNDYNTILNATGDGIMAYLEIPSIFTMALKMANWRKASDTCLKQVCRLVEKVPTVYWQATPV